jgi:hypothetical protein
LFDYYASAFNIVDNKDVGREWPDGEDCRWVDFEMSTQELK